MVDRRIAEIARRYFDLLHSEGVAVRRIVLFGSFAGGNPHEWSDIDFIVVLDDSVTGTEFDRVSTALWTIGQKIDIRIEPLAISETEWLHDDVTPVVILARSNGIELAA